MVARTVYGVYKGTKGRRSGHIRGKQVSFQRGCDKRSSRRRRSLAGILRNYFWLEISSSSSFFFLVVNERSLEKFRAIFFGEILGGGEFNESGNEYKFEAIDVAFRIHKLNRESSWRMLAR